MSALGDYIHLRNANYEKYGTTVRGIYDRVSNYEEYVKRRMSKIKELNPQTVDIMKKRLKGEADGIITKDAITAQKRFQDNIDKIYDAVAQKTTQGLIGQLTGSSGWKPTDYKSVEAKALQEGDIDKKRQLVGNIYNLIEQINQDGVKGQAKQKDIQQLVDYYNELSGKNLQPNKSSYGIIQEDIDNYSYYNWISNVAGDFGEMMVAAIQDTSEDEAIEVCNRTIEGIVGNVRTGGSFMKAEVVKDLTPYGVLTDSTGSNYIIKRTQDKVDVEIKVNQEDIFATVKNYHNPSQVTLQAQTSLFNALVYLQREGNFGNHFLNAHAGRNNKKPDARIADDAVRFELAYDALVGGNPLKEGASQANVFVIFNRENGDVMVKQTKDILTNELDRIIRKPYIEKLRFNNKATEEVQDRITNVLIQVHQLNLHVIYKVDASIDYN